MRCTSLLAGLGATLALVVAASVPAYAAPAPVGVPISDCSQPLPNGPAYLTKDLRCGLVMPTPGDEPVRTTLDMRGHRLRGPGTGTAIASPENLPSSSILYLENGRLDHWNTAIETSFTDVVADQVLIDHNQLGLSCGESSGCSFTRSVFSDNVVGTDSTASSSSFSRTVFRNNQLASRADSFRCCNGYTADRSIYTKNKVGVSLAIETDVTVTNSTFTRNGVGITSDPVVEDFLGWYVTLTGNRFEQNGDGIYLTPTPDFDTATIGGNVAVRNTRYGIYAPGAVDAGGNRESRNGKPCVGVVCSPTT